MCHFNKEEKGFTSLPPASMSNLTESTPTRTFVTVRTSMWSGPVCRQMYVITDLLCYYAANNSKTYVKVHKDMHLEEINDKAWMRGRLRGKEGMNEGMKVQDSRTEEMCVCLPVYKAA